MEADRWDARTYRNVRGPSAEMERFVRRHGDWGPAEELLADAWAALFKMEPRVRAEVPPSFVFLKRIVEYAMGTPEFRELREYTRLDEWASALGALALAEAALENAPDEVRSRIAEARRLEQEAEELLAESDPGSGERARALLAEADRVMASAPESLPRELRRAVREAIEAAGREQDAALRLAGDEQRPLSRKDRREAYELALALRRDGRLRRIAELAGRMVPMALQKRRTRTGVPQEPVDVGLGRDLARVVPSEFALLRHPVLRRDFFRRYAEGSLLEFQMGGREALGRGPIVCCVDVSGSMQGEKDVWAHAVALALLAVATRERRAFCLVHFGTEAVASLRVARGRRPSGAELREAMSVDFGGGTKFEPALELALDTIEGDGAFSLADVVFVTDGEADVDGAWLEEFRRRKRRLAVHVIAVVLGRGPGGTSAFADSAFGLAPTSLGEEVFRALA